MKTKQHSLWVIGLTVLLAGCNNSLDMEQQIDELYAKMPQEERIAQLQSMYMDDLFNEDGQLDTTKCRELIPYGIGHFSQFCMQKPRNPNELRNRVAAVQQWLMDNTPNGIPALMHEEVLSGVNTLGATIYPQQIGQACSFNTELAELKTRQTSTLLRKMGGVLALSPMVDVCRTPSFNRLEESYGEDGYLSAAMGVAFVKGLQQDDLTRGVGACSKHYLGYGGGGDADEKELMEEILMPHEAMIRLAGSRCVMPGYHAVHGTKCVANSEILQDILRTYIGFDGMVVSDYTAIDQLPLPATAPVDAAPPADAASSTDAASTSGLSVDGGVPAVVRKAAAALNGGNDVDFPFGANYKHLQQALDLNLVQPEALERAVKNVLRFKYRTGLLAGIVDGSPAPSAYLYSTEPIQLDTPEERQTAYDIATQSVVLLQNNGILPLTNGLSIAQLSSSAAQPSPYTVLLTGPNANSLWAMCGDYTYPAMSYFWKRMEDVANRDQPHIVRLLEGMTDCKPEGIDLLYERGCDWTEDIETKYGELGDERAWEYDLLHRKVDAGERADKAAALKLAAQADVIVAAMGENVMLCGENRDRQGLRLPGQQEQFVEQLLKTGKPVVLVLFGGRAQVVSGLAERCAAVVQAWYPGEEGGHAVADILYGNVSPSGKLSVSYPNTEVYEPMCYNNPSPLDVHPSLKAAGPLLVTPNSQWPFGHGLSYTTFEYSNLNVDKEASTADQSITLSFQVKNSGKVAADEVAQLYLSPTADDQNIRPIQLQGFARLSLQSGESKTVHVKLYTEQFGYYSHDGQRQWNILPGSFVVKIGSSSADIKLQDIVTLKGHPVSKPRREYFFSESSIQGE